ncbi:RDD family protein [Mycoplasmopsis agalactiae]|uniref:RDD family protein n=1 Tax=Mycoplasmopsis agalactiae TaxID=2110 RepID=UPI00211C2DD3|nr:RDD family protein [Mycoplasmopsis agalactiae]UUM25651.1 RDD family protein [Mycoplasmopsis agalactiae]
MNISETIWANYDPNSNYLPLREKFIEETNKYFENSVKKSNISVEECQTLAKNYEAAANKKEKTSRAVSSFLAWFIVFLVLGLVAFLWFGVVLKFKILDGVIYSSADLAQVIIAPILGVIFLGLSFGLFLIKFIKNKKQLIKDIIAKGEAYKKVSSAIEPLLSLLERHGIKEEILQKTMPEIKFDKYLMNEWYNSFVSEYGAQKLLSKSENTYCKSLLSGTLFTSPFIFVNKRGWRYVDVDYSGSITISWTETYYVNNEAKSRQRSEVLVATVTKPAPEFSDDNYLLFGSNEGTKLSFFRKPTKVNAMNEREIEKFLRKRGEELTKLTEKAIAKNSSFRVMSNTKFEALFDATNRDNEREYRELFTPLAQKNMTNLLLDKKNGYGDNFKFSKSGNVNLIENTQLEYEDNEIFKEIIECNSYSYNEIFNKFNQKMALFFKEFYFSIAPLLCIPNYISSIEKPLNKNNDRTLSYLELEKLAHSTINKSGKNNWTDTEFVVNISDMHKSDSNFEEFSVQAQGFSTSIETDYVTKMGSDGELHTIPVHWTLYTPEHREFVIQVGKINEFESNDSYLDELNEVLNEFADEDQSLAKGETLSSYVRVFQKGLN